MRRWFFKVKGFAHHQQRYNSQIIVPQFEWFSDCGGLAVFSDKEGLSVFFPAFGSADWSAGGRKMGWRDGGKSVVSAIRYIESASQKCRQPPSQSPNKEQAARWRTNGSEGGESGWWRVPGPVYRAGPAGPGREAGWAGSGRDSPHPQTQEGRS